MIKPIFIISLMIFGVLASSTTLFADPITAIPSNPFKNGFYASGTFGYGKTGENGFNITKDRNFLWSAAGGYRFDKYIAGEGGYLSYPNLEVGHSIVKPSAFYGAIKGIYPIDSKMDMFAKVGVARTDISSNEAAIDDLKTHSYIPLFAVGGDYYVNHNLAITAQGLTTLQTSHSFPSTYGMLFGLSYTF